MKIFNSQENAVRSGWEQSVLSWAILIAQAVVAILFSATLSNSVNAAVFDVASGDVNALIDAINTANGNGEDDTINLESGVYTLTEADNETDGANGLPSITSNITINGAGADGTIIERVASDFTTFRIFHVASTGTLMLNGLAVTGGFADFGENEFGEGGGIFNLGTLTLNNSAVSNNRARDTGGGITNGGDATLTLDNSIVSDNSVSGSTLLSVGGGIANVGTLILNNSMVSSNTAVGAEDSFGGLEEVSLTGRRRH